MENLVSFIISKAKAECRDLERDVAVFASPSIFDIACKHFNLFADYPNNKCKFRNSEVILRKAVISGEGIPHYQSVYVINNNSDIEERVLKELLMVPGIRNEEPMLYSEIDISEKYGN